MYYMLYQLTLSLLSLSNLGRVAAVLHFSVYSLFPEKNQQSYRTISVVYTEGVDREYQHFGLGIYH